MSDKEYTPVSPRAWLIFYAIILLIAIFFGGAFAERLTGNRNGLIGKWLEGDKTTQPTPTPDK